MLPGMPGGRNAMKEMADAIDEGELTRAEAMIQSMTAEERRNPGIISGSRRLRIANGSGVTTADVNGLLKDFEGARKMMRAMMGGKRVPGMMKVPSGEAPEAIDDETRRTKAWRRGSDCGGWARTSGPSTASWWPISGSPRDGRFIENIGKYHPLEDPSLIEIDEERALHWLRVGAQPSSQVRNLMVKTGIWDKFVAERPVRRQARPPKPEKPAKPKLSKKAAAKAAEAATAAEAPPEAAEVEVVEAEVAEVETAEPTSAEPTAVEEAVEVVEDAAPAEASEA